MAKSFTHMHAVEVALMRRWSAEGKRQSEIAALLGRSSKTVSNHLKRRGNEKIQKGRPRKMTKEVYTGLRRVLTKLLKKAGGEKEVTVAMVKAASGCDCSLRTIRDAFHADGIRFRRLREKPILSRCDVVARRRFADLYAAKLPSQWLKSPHAVIDNKNFPLYLSKSHRAHAARRSVRGAYRQGKDACAQHLVKPQGSLKLPVKSVVVTAAVIKGRIRVWRYTRGRWNGQAAADMYSDTLAKALKRVYPAARKFLVLEDNDPTGYKSGKGMAAKASSKIATLDLPRRSPDLNVLDYSLWHAINVRMRAQELSFAATRRETQEQYKARLRRTALSLPASVVTRAVRDMARRVRALRDSRGKLINE